MKKKVTLFGGSGTMGFETFKVLWDRRDRLDITLLLRPSEKNRKLFKPYIRKAGVPRNVEKGTAKGLGLTIQWGDAVKYNDVKAAVAGTDCVLDAMAFISPMADYLPKRAREVNTDGIRNIVRAIEEEPGGAERIRLAYTGTVAETGDRLPPIHWGRTGDPLKPSIFDYYAVTKIAGERAVLESGIRHWVSLRLTYIMPMTYKELSALSDPIAFHMPYHSCMENVTSRDAGLGLANVVDVPEQSDFWRRIYNMGGGPKMRLTAYDYMNRSMKLFGSNGIETGYERKWFATQNFHMQYYADSHELNNHLNYWRDSIDDWERMIQEDLPLGLKIVSRLARNNPKLAASIAEKSKELSVPMVAKHRNGTAYWFAKNNTKRLDAFFGGREAYEKIPGWGVDMEELKNGDTPEGLLDHGYDESKETLELKDLQGVAEFRGGSCETDDWSGDLFRPVEWKCAFGHSFTVKPNTVLKGGHWCPECEAPDWDFKRIAERNPFFAQVIEPFKDKIPDYAITEADLADIEEAHKDKV